MLLQKRAHGQQKQLIACGRFIQGAAARIGQRHGPWAGAERDLVPGGAQCDLAGRKVSVEQAGIKQLAQHGQALVIPAAQGLHIAPLHALLVELAAQLVQHCGQLRGVDGLEDVFGYPHADRLAGVLKVVKAGENHELGCREELLEPPAQLQPIHERHFDIGEHDVGV